MKTHSFKPELLAPAGNFEKLEIAVHYGADAVYLSGNDFSLRNFSQNFTQEDLFEAVNFAHKHKVKVYLACNIFLRTCDFQKLKTFLSKVAKIRPDAVIISDPGLIMLAKEIIPDIELHLSTQANTTNLYSVNFWHSLGIKRINLARELNLEQIKQITSKTKAEIETFIHGAMCISYSGRCLMSSFLTNRDSNRGLCSHPCRWEYSVVEKLRPGQYHTVYEDKHGTYIFNSKDLCMIEHIPQLIDAKITSFKIEGRMKGIGYLASVVSTYRKAIDAYVQDPTSYRLNPDWIRELDNFFHRQYCKGFYFNKPDESLQNYENIHKGKIHSFIGRIEKIKSKKKLQKNLNECTIKIKNTIKINDTIEVFSFVNITQQTKIKKIFDTNNNPIERANPNTTAILILEIKCCLNDIVRKVKLNKI